MRCKLVYNERCNARKVKYNLFEKKEISKITTQENVGMKTML